FVQPLPGEDTGLDPLGQRYFLFRAEQWCAADGAQVVADRVVADGAEGGGGGAAGGEASGGQRIPLESRGCGRHRRLTVDHLLRVGARGHGCAQRSWWRG